MGACKKKNSQLPLANGNQVVFIYHYLPKTHQGTWVILGRTTQKPTQKKTPHRFGWGAETKFEGNHSLM